MRARERYWPEVEHFFSGLLPHVFRDAKLLQYDLALRYSDTGEFKDVLPPTHRFPLLDLGSWVLDDLAVPEGPRRDDIERPLFVAAVLFLASLHAFESIEEGSSFRDRRDVPLARFLWERALGQLAAVIPASSPFWRRHAEITLGHLEAMLRGDGRNRWSVPGKLVAAAAVAAARRDELIPTLEAIVEALSQAAQIGDDLATIQSDLENGRVTYPIAVIAETAGIPLARPLPTTQILGAMVVTNALRRIGDVVGARLASGRSAAVIAGFPTFIRHIDGIVSAFDVLARASPSAEELRPDRDVPTLHAEREAPAIAPATIAKALEMSEAFLLSDLTFREAIEVHREGMFGAPLVRSRFPVGLVLEILCAHGHNLAPQVDAFRAFVAANRFRYFDHPACDMDSDTLGVYLRLGRYASADDTMADELARALDFLARDVATLGSVPVWITDWEQGPRPSRAPALRLGESCGTVEAHMLLGLTASGFGLHRSTIERAASDLLDRVSRSGLAANVNYPPLFALGVFFRLVSCLGRRTVGAELARCLASALASLRKELDAAIRMAVSTPQEAALLTIACDRAGARSLIEPEWMRVILKQQRYDGSWPGEAFAETPNRGGSVTWYSSGALTTALCCDALMRHAQRKSGRTIRDGADA